MLASRIAGDDRNARRPSASRPSRRTTDAETSTIHGGDVTVVHLPEVGIKGNTHFPMSDLNNVQIADLVATFIAEKRLD